MHKPFILGLAARIGDSPFLPTAELCARAGHNTGNLAFHHAINEHLGGDLPSVPWDNAPDAIDRAGTLAVLPCANQLGPHQDYASLAARFAALDTPIVAIGLGAQAGTDGAIPEVPAGTLDWVRAIGARGPGTGPNIAVRGAFTLRVLKHYGLADHAVVLGCPSLFINPDPALGRRIAARGSDFRRIAVAAGHQKWTHLAHIEASLAHMVSATHGSYVGQSPLEMLQLTRGEAHLLDHDSLAACRNYIGPGMNDEEFLRWTVRHGQVFFDVAAWMEHYRRFDLVVGTRIHGIMLALQAGVPALCIAHDSRTLELCRTMQVPYVLSRDVQQGIRRDQLHKLLRFDPDKFDANRRTLCARYIGFLEHNGLQPAQWLRRIAAPAAAPEREAA